jgi:hypothetical protein
VAQGAQFTLNAMSGGYCFERTQHGTQGMFTKPGPYRVLMEGLESMATLIAGASMDKENQRNYAVNEQGFRYLSSIPSQSGEIRPSKADWGALLSSKNGR